MRVRADLSSREGRGAAPAPLTTPARFPFAFRGACGRLPAVAGRKKIPLGQSDFGHAPFAGLNLEGLPLAAPTEADTPPPPAAPPPAPRNRGRVDIIRQKAGRGGKTVTVITGFVGIGLPEKERLAKTIQKSCGTGGTVKEGRIERQGHNRAVAPRILREAGFRPVFAGG